MAMAGLAESLKRRGVMLVLSSPSGAGKTSISKAILARDGNIAPSISVTTRAMRPAERDGEDYHFVSHDAFQNLVRQGQLLEYAEVFGNFYGTPRTPVDNALQQGRDLIFDIDWQGARQLTENARDDLVTVFVLPPHASELERRLMARAQDAAETIEKRMAKAPDELSHYPEYDYVVVNHDLETSVEQVLSILHAERARRQRFVGLAQFVRGLQEQVRAKYPGGELQ
jgi:guanylate kinase